MKNLNRKNLGFTLIELLVVVAIIGILASVVLASLNTARAKGANAAVKADMANIRAQAEIYYDNHANKYATGAISACTSDMFTDTNISAALAQIIQQTPSTNSTACFVDATGQLWAMSVSALKEAGTWCVDNSGWAKPGVAKATGICAIS